MWLQELQDKIFQLFLRKHWNIEFNIAWEKKCKHRHGIYNESLCIVYTVNVFMPMYVHVYTRNLYLGKCDL